MAMFENMRLSTRINLQQSVLVVGIIGLSAFSLYSMRQIDHEIVVVSSEMMPLVEDLTVATEHQLNQNYLVEKALRYSGVAVRDSNREVVAARLIDEVAKANEDVEKDLAKARKDLETALAMDGSDELKAELRGMVEEIDRITDKHDALAVQTNRMLDLLRGGRVEQAAELAEVVEKGQQEMGDALIALMNNTDHSMASKLASANDHADLLVVVLWIVTAVAAVLASIMSYYSSATLGGLRNGMSRIGNSVQQVASAASQSSNAISMVADGAKQQSQAIEQAVTAVNQSVAVLSDVSSNAERATILSKEAATTVEDGRGQMRDMISVVNRIAENSTRINKITEVISNIASQTNMLSLNAAIEAARAGEHGKGFAVVAEQVRKLAESSKASVQEIVDLLSLATRDANEAVVSADRVNEEMAKIANAALETEKMMQGIATSMEEQVATTEELQHNMDTLKNIGNNNANAAEEITQTILELSRIADETNGEVGRFHI